MPGNLIGGHVFSDGSSVRIYAAGATMAADGVKLATRVITWDEMKALQAGDHHFAEGDWPWFIARKMENHSKGPK